MENSASLFLDRWPLLCKLFPKLMSMLPMTFTRTPTSFEFMACFRVLSNVLPHYLGRVSILGEVERVVWTVIFWFCQW